MMDEIKTRDDIEIIGFKWHHPRGMHLRDFELEMYELVPDFEQQLRYYELEKHSYTALHRGNIIACFGSHVIWPGVAESWMMGSKQLNNIPISLTRTALRYMDAIMRDEILNRMQITCNTQDELAVRWAIALKFEQEGLLRNYGPSGTDYIMFSRIRDEQSIQS